MGMFRRGQRDTARGALVEPVPFSITPGLDSTGRDSTGRKSTGREGPGRESPGRTDIIGDVDGRGTGGRNNEPARSRHRLAILAAVLVLSFGGALLLRGTDRQAPAPPPTTAPAAPTIAAAAVPDPVLVAAGSSLCGSCRLVPVPAAELGPQHNVVGFTMLRNGDRRPVAVLLREYYDPYTSVVVIARDRSALTTRASLVAADPYNNGLAVVIALPSTVLGAWDSSSYATFDTLEAAQGLTTGRRAALVGTARKLQANVARLG